MVTCKAVSQRVCLGWITGLKILLGDKDLDGEKKKLQNIEGISNMKIQKTPRLIKGINHQFKCLLGKRKANVQQEEKKKDTNLYRTLWACRISTTANVLLSTSRRKNQKEEEQKSNQNKNGASWKNKLYYHLSAFPYWLYANFCHLVSSSTHPYSQKAKKKKEKKQLWHIM